MASALPSAPPLPDDSNPILTRIARLVSLSAIEEEVLRQVPRFARSHARQTELSAQGEAGTPRILLAGWAIHQHIARNGRRQITQFLLPGDLIGSAIRPTTPSISTVVALTPVVVADARPLIQAIDGANPSMPGLACAVRLLAQADAIRVRDHILRLGGQSAYERLTHLVLELYHRMRDIGMADGDDFRLPLTQEMLADALGMSFVHTNRVLQQIRRDGLFSVQGRQVTLLQPELMRNVADWAPSDGVDPAPYRTDAGHAAARV